MRRWLLLTTCVVLFVILFLLITAGRQQLPGIAQMAVTSALPEQGMKDNGGQSTPDTRRDLFIDAERAPRAPALAAGNWINSEPLSLDSLRGRVVLIDFWTFGCYNCRNTLPALKGWHERYSERGLTIIGVHSPEFDYEKEISNVRRQVSALGISYAVLTDNDFETWNKYGIRAWPTVVLLDKQGRIRWTHIGEGKYAETEKAMQKLLAE